MLIEKTNTGNKFHGQALGIVKRENGDGTFKVWIPGIYDAQFAETPENLPDARILYPPFGGDDMDHSLGGPLMVGTKVFCFFDNAEITKPIIVGKYLSDEIYQSTATNNQTTLDKQYSWKLGNSLVKFKESGTIELLSLESPEKEDSPVAKITMDKTGRISLIGKEISIDSETSLFVHGEKVEISSGTTTEIAAETNISLDAENIVFSVSV